MKNQVYDFPASTRVTWTNSVGRSGSGSAVAITGGQMLRMGVMGLFAVAMGALATSGATATGVVETRGTFKLPKATGVAHSVGQRLGYDFGNDRVTTDVTGGVVGTVRKASLSADTTVEVEINEASRRRYEQVLTPSAGEDSANQMDVDVGFPVAGAFVHAVIINSSNVPRLPGTVVFAPSSALTTIRLTESNLAATDKVHLMVLEAASA
ncbi:MAG: DUF2190 family protein [Phycisphaerales bacterium]